MSFTNEGGSCVFWFYAVEGHHVHVDGRVQSPLRLVEGGCLVWSTWFTLEINEVMTLSEGLASVCMAIKEC